MDWKSGKVNGFAGKELLNLKNGGVKMITIASKAVYPIHSHPDKTEFLFLLEGQIMCTIESEEYQGEQGDFFLFPSGKEHNIQNQSVKDALALVGSIND